MDASSLAPSTTFDVCIVGAGPGGLSTLSACLEPYSHDHLNADQAERAAHSAPTGQLSSVCVVDPEPWMSAWKRRFAELDINWLRSPAMAHPDAFDAWNLMAYAKKHDRIDEFRSAGAESLQATWKQLKGIHEVGSGLFGLPSTSLFLDFCDDLASKLPHTFVRARAEGVEGEDGAYEVRLSDGSSIKARAVVMAVGFPGPAIVPPCFAGLPAELCFHTEDCERLSALRKGQRVLVVGGGLTGVQAAQLAIKRGCRVTVSSRRKLVTRQFDIPLEWFDFRMQGKMRHEFWAEPKDTRLAKIKETRGGGSVPPCYMEQLRAAENLGKVEILQGDVEVLSCADGVVDATVSGLKRRFDQVVLACGHRPGCLELPLFADLQRRFPCDLHGGLPVLSEDLQWGDSENLFVVGALAGLQVGPDSANLMGCRRAAQIVAQALGVRSWLRADAGKNKGRNITVVGNRYANLFSDDEEEEDDEDSTTDDDSDQGELTPSSTAGEGQSENAS